MPTELIHNRGRGPELVGTRLTVYNLLPHLLDPTVTEGQVCDMYDLAPKQVAAMRAYVLTHYDDVMREHRSIEEIHRQKNPPAVTEHSHNVRKKLKRFQEWLAETATANECTSPPVGGSNSPTVQARICSFKEWLAAKEAGPTNEPAGDAQ